MITKNKNKAKISMTDFIEFVLKTGTRKQSLVRSIKRREKYSPEFDFWKKLREALVEYHRGNKPKCFLDEVIDSIIDEKKLKNYPASIIGYKKFLGRKNINWFSPPYVKYELEELSIRVNPELGLKFRDKKYVVKLYFKDERLSKHEVDLITLLMKLAIDPENENDYEYSIIEVKRGKFHNRKPDDSILPLLEGEALNFVRVWDKLK